MTERTEPCLGIDHRLPEPDRLLPERAPDHCEVAFPDNSNSNQAELRIGAADHDRRAGLESGVRGCALTHMTGDSARLQDRREQLALHVADFDDLRRPGTGGEIEHPGTRADGRVGEELARQPVCDPVGEHVDVGGVAKHGRLVTFDPAQPGGCGDRHPVAALAVNLLGEPALHQLGGLRAGSRVDVGAGPDLTSSLVVEHHAFAHARCADRTDRARIDAWRLQHRTDAFRDEPPVGGGVEDLRAWNPFHCSMAPFPLGHRHLPATRLKHDRPAAPSARIERQQQGLAHT